MTLMSFPAFAVVARGSVNILLLLIQIALIIMLSRLVAWLFSKINQPLVVGEIVAGMLLGSSCFGYLAPDLAAQVFLPETIPYRNILAQVGLIFFMFLGANRGQHLDDPDHGAEIDVGLLREDRRNRIRLATTDQFLDKQIEERSTSLKDRSSSRIALG